MSKFIKLGGSSGSGSGSSTFDGLSDKASVDLPGINTPLANALSGKVTGTNKKTDVDANKTSDTFFPSVKAVFDWVSGLFVKGAASSTDNAIARFDGTTGKLVQNSAVVVNDTGGMNLPGQLEFPVAAGLVYFGNFGSAINNKVGFSVPGVVVLGIDAVTKRLGVGGAGAWFAANAPDALLHVLSRSTTDTTVLVQAIAGQTSNLVSVSSNTGATAFSVSASGDVRVHGNLLDNVGSPGVDGQVLKKVGGLVKWANP